MAKDIKLYELVSPSCAILSNMYMYTYSNKKMKLRIMEAKFRMLIHEIISKMYSSCSEEDGEIGLAYLNSVALQRIYGEDYIGKMLRLLISMGIVIRKKGYNTSKHTPFGYCIDVNQCPIIKKEISKEDWEKYYIEEEYVRARTKAYFEKRQEELKQSYADRFFKGNTKFIERYLHDLSLVKIEDAEALYSNVDELDYQSMVDAINAEKKKGQRKATVDFLQGCYEEIAHYMVEQTSRWSYDDRGRIYHRLTRSPRILRHHFNIKFSIDNHNSQPLLFSTLLTRFYRITRAQLDMFCDICEHDEKTRKYPLAFVPGDSSKPIHLLPIYKEKYSWSQGSAYTMGIIVSLYLYRQKERLVIFFIWIALFYHIYSFEQTNIMKIISPAEKFVS